MNPGCRSISEVVDLPNWSTYVDPSDKITVSFDYEQLNIGLISNDGGKVVFYPKWDSPSVSPLMWQWGYQMLFSFQVHSLEPSSDGLLEDYGYIGMGTIIPSSYSTPSQPLSGDIFVGCMFMQLRGFNETVRWTLCHRILRDRELLITELWDQITDIRWFGEVYTFADDPWVIEDNLTEYLPSIRIVYDRIMGGRTVMLVQYGESQTQAKSLYVNANDDISTPTVLPFIIALNGGNVGHTWCVSIDNLVLEAYRCASP